MANPAKNKLAALNAAFKAVITTSDFGLSILQPTAYNRFLQILQEKNNILQQTRRIDMPTQQVNIDRTGFIARVLRAGDDSAGVHKVLVQSEYAQPTFAQNKLIAFEVQGTTSIYDKALRRNIERQRYINTLLSGFTNCVGRDLEELFLFMRTTYNPATDLLLSKGSGWVDRAANKLYGVDKAGGGNPKDFDPAATGETGFPRNMFQAMLLALPKQYIQNTSEWVFFVDWATMDAWREQLAREARSGNASSESALLQGTVHDYKGIRVEYAPMLQKGATIGAGGVGRVAMLQNPNNMAWGVFHEVTVEPSRWPEERRTAYVVTAEVDADYEDENAVVVALVDGQGP